jgi:hypothetical protein
LNNPIGFENDQLHSSLRLGDIVVMVNNKPITCTNEYTALRKEFGKTTPVTALRMLEKGSFQMLVLNFLDDDPRVAFLDLMEKIDNP